MDKKTNPVDVATERYIHNLDKNITALEDHIEAKKDEYLGEVNDIFSLLKEDIKKLIEMHEDSSQIKKICNQGFKIMFVDNKPWTILNSEDKFHNKKQTMVFIKNDNRPPYRFYTCLNQD